MINLKNISKSFGPTKAVNNLSLSIKSGEIVGFLGPNGAGKTTTMRIMAGVLPVSKGSITIDGKKFSTNEAELKSKIGYLPENNPLFDEMTVEEHLLFWAQMKGLQGKKRKNAIDFGVESTHIQEVYYKTIKTLSKGYRQRVGLAQAILAKPEILLLDEPTEGLDPNQRQDIQKLLSNLKKSRTVIVSSHVLTEISKMANRLVIIHNGQLVADGSPSSLTKNTGNAVKIKIEVTGKKIVETLKKIPKVSKVTKSATDTYEMSYAGKDDIRALLFNLAVEQKWTLLSSSISEQNLEDIFSKLTKN